MEGGVLRKCASIKSRKHPGSSCTAKATFGDYCSRHYKNPIRFQSASEKAEVNSERIYTRFQAQAIHKLQKFWRRWAALNRWKHQGPARNDMSLAHNSTEVYSLEPIDSIPSMFFFSFADEHKNIWAFDIRSLSHLVSEGTDIQNPYTRQRIDSKTLHQIHDRLLWLRKRKYPILYATGENLTASQLWNQKVLDVFFKMEALGYRASCHWFEDLNLTDHENFYRRLYRLWTYQLGLTNEEKEAILPGHDKTATKLFHHTPEKLQGGSHDLKWWRRNNLNLILEFLTRANQKSQQALGALYVLMALVLTIPEASEAYPWVRESIRAVY